MIPARCLLSSKSFGAGVFLFPHTHIYTETLYRAAPSPLPVWWGGGQRPYLARGLSSWMRELLFFFSTKHLWWHRSYGINTYCLHVSIAATVAQPWRVACMGWDGRYEIEIVASVLVVFAAVMFYFVVIGNVLPFVSLFSHDDGDVRCWMCIHVYKRVYECISV